MKTQTKKRLCAAAGWLAFLTMLGTVGGMELGTVTVGAGAALALGLAAVWAALLYKAGWLRLPGPQPGGAGAGRRGEAGRTREQGRLRRCEKSDRASTKAGWIRWRS